MGLGSLDLSVPLPSVDTLNKSFLLYTIHLNLLIGLLRMSD